ncbi:hypothetical protein JL720_9951 [Aureococcus anophagefferens]|nr:hypothetical protein JL720_9951 [Aureococcus anophagefferens]
MSAFAGGDVVLGAPCAAGAGSAAVAELLWFTYRCGFEELAPYGFTDDAGWGCMLRSAQMLLGNALTRNGRRRGWRRRRSSRRAGDSRRSAAGRARRSSSGLAARGGADVAASTRTRSSPRSPSATTGRSGPAPRRPSPRDAKKLAADALDPSLALAFYCADRDDFLDFVGRARALPGAPLFEVVDAAPRRGGACFDDDDDDDASGGGGGDDEDDRGRLTR